MNWVSNTSICQRSLKLVLTCLYLGPKARQPLRAQIQASNSDMTKPQLFQAWGATCLPGSVGDNIGGRCPSLSSANWASQMGRQEQLPVCLANKCEGHKLRWRGECTGRCVGIVLSPELSA